MNQEGEEGACYSCQRDHRRCDQDCLMAFHFPPGTEIECEAVHQTFGYKKVIDRIKGRLLGERNEIIRSLVWEPIHWTDHPVGGPMRAYRLRGVQKNNLRHQLVEVQGQLAALQLELDQVRNQLTTLQQQQDDQNGNPDDDGAA